MNVPLNILDCIAEVRRMVHFILEKLRRELIGVSHESDRLESSLQCQ